MTGVDQSLYVRREAVGSRSWPRGWLLRRVCSAPTSRADRRLHRHRGDLRRPRPQAGIRARRGDCAVHGHPASLDRARQDVRAVRPRRDSHRPPHVGRRRRRAAPDHDRHVGRIRRVTASRPRRHGPQASRRLLGISHCRDRPYPIGSAESLQTTRQLHPEDARRRIESGCADDRRQDRAKPPLRSAFGRVSRSRSRRRRCIPVAGHDRDGRRAVAARGRARRRASHRHRKRNRGP